MRNRSRISFLGVLVAAVVTAEAAAEAPVLVASPPAGGARTPLVAPTGGGYGVVWWDFRDAGQPGRLGGGLRFARFDLAGHRVGDEVFLTLEDPLASIYDAYLGGHLEGQRDGFLLVAHVDASSIQTLRLDAASQPRGPSHPLAAGNELYVIVSVASGPSGRVIAYIPTGT